MSQKDAYMQPPSPNKNQEADLNFEYQNIPLKKAKKDQRHLGRKIVSGKIDTKLPKNEISTSKYNFLTFIPKNLFEQFSRPANIYFLIIGIMQTIDAISVTEGTPDTFAPLFVIVLITAVKDLYEDIKRHRSDREENRKTTSTLDPATVKFEKKYWYELRVGNIIKIHKDEYVPADILLLLSSDTKGQAFIETKNLDGETNLKHKVVPKGLIKRFKGVSSGEEFNVQTRVIFNFEAPNPYLYTFNGSITAQEGEKMPLDANNFVLRGCSLRNTDWIYGLVTYTGPETKIMLNSVKPRTKRSRVEQFMNIQIGLIFLFQIFICVFAALWYAIWYNDKEDDLDYLEILQGTKDTETSYNFGTRFGTWMLIFSNLVPISLLVTLEMVKFIQGTVISKDKHMFHIETQTGTVVQSSNLNEELGQIEYIFSDKTGTLTQNYMEFKKLIAKGVPYGLQADMKDISSYTEVTNVNFRDSTFFNAINKNDKAVEDYLISLAACHTIITEKKEGKLFYNAASPDELALVNFARFVGCEFIGTDEDGNMLISFKGKTIKFKLLQVLEFTSKRKRMSVILENEKGETILYTKGADSMILERMQKEKNPEIDETMKHLSQFADEGLRTLLVAYKIIPKDEYARWAKQYSEAATAAENREEKMEELQAKIEEDLLLIGATAIEDKLQDEVGPTIAFLKSAGIKVWVLTGDKIETAINIGFACNLLNKELKIIIVDGKSKEEVSKSLEEAQRKVDKRKTKQPNNLKIALVVSGDALIEGMQEPLSSKLMQIGELCEAVICCRVSPKQKAEVVSLVRKHKPKVSTLAIGDGANDVNMITAAQVGVGIRGVEGQQAARASDYAFGEFKFLKRLLVYYGRESYRRNSTLILYNFYKNVLLVLPIFWIGFDMAFSGQMIYENWLYSLFNLFYASLPIVLYAFLDNEYDNKNQDLLVYPFLYEAGIKNQHFNAKRFWLWFFNSIYQSVILGIFSVYILGNAFITDDGMVADMYLSGAMILALCVAIANFKILTFSHTHNPVTLFVIFGSIALYILSFLIVNYITGNEFEDMFGQLYSIANFWFGSVVIVVATTFFDLGNERQYRLSELKRLKKRKAEYNAKKAQEEAMKKEEKGLQDTELEPLVVHGKGGVTSPVPPVSQRAQTPNTLDARGPMERKPSKSYGHTGYAFSQEEGGNNFINGRRKGLDHPQN